MYPNYLAALITLLILSHVISALEQRHITGGPIIESTLSVLRPLPSAPITFDTTPSIGSTFPFVTQPGSETSSHKISRTHMSSVSTSVTSISAGSSSSVPTSVTVLPIGTSSATTGVSPSVMMSESSTGTATSSTSWSGSPAPATTSNAANFVSTSGVEGMLGAILVVAAAALGVS